jgi:monovalent cation/hydrogen antiporter
VRTARSRALHAGLSSVADKDSAVAEGIRREFASHLAHEPADPTANDPTRSAHSELHRRAVEAARQAVLAMRASNEIGDDAFHQIEEELDWLEMANRRTTE